MSISLSKTDPARRPDEYAPMVPAAVREALRGHHYAGLALYCEVQSLPDGWDTPDTIVRDRLAWSASMMRKAKRALIEAGLYVVERIRTAAGWIITVGRYLTNPFAQVGPGDPLPDVGRRPRIPLSTERTERVRRGRSLGVHTPETCQREAAGLPCRHCAKARAADVVARASSGRRVPPVAALADLPPVPAPASPAARCEHGHRRVACLACASASPGGRGQ